MTPPANPTTPAAAAADQPATAVHDGRARRIPFLLMIGAELTHEADGVAVVAIDLRPDLLNNHGGGHGGVVMSLLDSAMANAGVSQEVRMKLTGHQSGAMNNAYTHHEQRTYADALNRIPRLFD